MSKAKDLVFSGRFVDAKEALALGLIDEMVAPDAVYDAAVAGPDASSTPRRMYWPPPRLRSTATVRLPCMTSTDPARESCCRR